MEEQVFVIQRKIKDVNLTRLAVGDLWHLVNPTEERSIYEQLEEHEATLKAMAPEGPEPVDSRKTDTGLRLGDYRKKKFILAATEEKFSVIQHANEELPFQTDENVTQVVFVLHGIRDLGRWAAQFEEILVDRFENVLHGC